MTVYPFTSHAVVHSGEARVTLAGELDLDTAPYVHDAVATCLAKRPTRLCLDLSGVSFCDCAGVNALFTARILILRSGADLLVEGIGTQLGRLLSLLGADALLTTHGTPAHAASARAASGAAGRRPAPAVAAAESAFGDLLA
ncbi:STAS domain-containing protein [Streptomyces sp. NPDC058284]|uniref:STAS domain-containing protein n=1 Tax=unclassified Streptomyces TaxID=2593676 RepID=UPI003659F3AD